MSKGLTYQLNVNIPFDLIRCIACGPLYEKTCFWDTCDKIMLEPGSSAENLNVASTAFIIWERSRSVVQCLTRDRGAAGSSLTVVTALCP